MADIVQNIAYLSGKLISTGSWGNPYFKWYECSQDLFRFQHKTSCISHRWIGAYLSGE